MPTVKTAISTVHRDREWWRKVLIGGAVWLTVVGYPIVEGFQLESIENTEKGFPAPLPRWDMFGTKMVIGLFAIVIDFFFFVFPLFIAGFLLLCAAFAVALADIRDSNLRFLGMLASAVPLGWLGFAWLSSVSPVAKRRFAVDGEPSHVLSSKVIHEAWQQPARKLYLHARLQSLPLYLLPLILFAAALTVQSWSGWLALPLIWLGLSSLLYVRLVVIQLYAGAAHEAQQRAFEAFQRRVHS